MPWLRFSFSFSSYFPSFLFFALSFTIPRFRSLCLSLSLAFAFTFATFKNGYLTIFQGPRSLSNLNYFDPFLCAQLLYKLFLSWITRGSRCLSYFDLNIVCIFIIKMLDFGMAHWVKSSFVWEQKAYFPFNLVTASTKTTSIAIILMKNAYLWNNKMVEFQISFAFYTSVTLPWVMTGNRKTPKYYFNINEEKYESVKTLEFKEKRAKGRWNNLKASHLSVDGVRFVVAYKFSEERLHSSSFIYSFSNCKSLDIFPLDVHSFRVQMLADPMRKVRVDNLYAEFVSNWNEWSDSVK